MADSGNRIVTFSLNLDTGDFTNGLTQATTQLQSLGDAKNTEGTISGLKEMALQAGEVYGVFKTLEFISDSVFDADKINQTNKAFETLSAQAGVMGTQFKSAMAAASQGLMSESEQMESANKAFVQLGQGAAKLPELLDLANKAGKIMGGDITQNLQDITQAIASGNTRLLRRLGINIDAKKAEEDYAKSIGVTTAELSQQGLIQARLNAVLEQGNEKFGSISTAIETPTTALKKLGASFSDMRENVSLAIGGALGPTFVSAFEKARGVVEQFSNFMAAHFGDGLKQSGAQVEELKNQLAGLQSTMKTIQEGHSGESPEVDKMHEAALQKQIDETQAAITKIEGINKAGTDAKVADEKKAAEAASAANQASVVDAQKSALQKSAFEKELDSIRSANTKKQISEATSVDQVDALVQQTRMDRVHQFEQFQDQTNAKVAAGTLRQEQASQLIYQQQKSMILDLAKIDEQAYQQRIAALQHYATTTKSMTESLEASQKAEVMKMAGNQGMAFTLMNAGVASFKKNFETSFEELGKGQKNASDVIKGIFFGMLSDMAQQEGEFLLATSIYPPNPLGLAAAAGCFALAGVLSSMAGASGSSSSSGGSSSSGASSAAVTPVAANATPTAAAQTTNTPNVTLQVQGSYFETEQTKTRLMDLIRQATDQTDFKYVQVGGGNP